MTVDPTELEELEETTKSFENRKSPGKDGMNTKFLKYVPVEIEVR
jgi:hypothetical protein